MEVELKINKAFTDERVTIEAPEMTDKIKDIVEYLNTDEDVLYGKMNEDIYPLNLKHVTQFFTEAGQVNVILDSKEKMRLSERLYEIEKKVPKNFVRISKSEIINMDDIKKLRLTGTGMIQIFMKSGRDTYSSRRYLKVLKERVSL